ncbi:MAG TPA: hypothetical protein VN200_01055 [Rhodoglobus sp.]|nr:hypothetical protein [Rhodoglobus sp.]
MAADREQTPDPDLVTPATDPTPEELEQDREDLDAVNRWAGEPKPAEGEGPLP